MHKPMALSALTTLGTLLCVAALHCQTIEVTVKGPKNTVKSTVTVNKLPTITSFSCLPAVVNEGDNVTCGLTIDIPAPAAGYKFPIVSTGVTLPDAVTVPSGATTASFSFVAPPVPIAANKENRRFLAMQFGPSEPNSGLPLSWVSVFQYYWIP